MNDVTRNRKDRLRKCEQVLTEHLEEFVKVGRALQEIRDDKLYREDGFSTFEQYCHAKWAALVLGRIGKWAPDD